MNAGSMKQGDRQTGAVGAGPSLDENTAPTIGDWLHIEEDGAVIVFTGKAEVGQDIRTSLAQAVADELRLSVDTIRLVMADTDQTPYDAGTFGSRTTPFMALHLRKVAASTRTLLVDLAAEQWGVDAATLTVGGGQVRDPATGRSVGFGALTHGLRMTQEYGDDVPITPAEEWTIAGTTTARVEGRAIVTGRRRYTPDLVRPGMVYGMILRPPSFGAHLVSLDARLAAALPTTEVVHDGDFVGVVAGDRALAIEARDALQAAWATTEQIASNDLFAYLRTHLAPPDETNLRGGPLLEESGSVVEGRAAADRIFEATYTVAYIAHAPLEARAALAEWHEGRLTVWTGSQRPFGIRTELAEYFNMAERDIRVIVPDTGAAYGGKHSGEVAVEAARLAQAVGKPVKLIWMREEEFTWAYFRPGGVIDIAAAVHADGSLVAWEFDNYNSGGAGIQMPYEVLHRRIAFHPVLEPPLRQGAYRALATTANTFAREVHLDTIAHALGLDPLAFRLKNLRHERLLAVLIAATENFGWSQRQRLAGHGYGLALGTEKGSYVSACVEIAVDPQSREVRIVRIVQAFECGAIVNPDGLRNQVEGAIVQGMGGALWEAIDFANGAVLTDRFSKYRVPRFADIPSIEVVLLDRKDLPSAGAGETPLVAIAPAIGNAIFDATGLRLRSLPMTPHGVLPKAI